MIKLNNFTSAARSSSYFYNNIFDALMNLWHIPFSCKYSIASIIYLTHKIVCPSYNLDEAYFFNYSAKVPPLQYSSNKYIYF